MKARQKLASLLRKWVWRLDGGCSPLTVPVHVEVSTSRPIIIKHCRCINQDESREYVDDIKKDMKRAIASQLVALYDDCIAVTENPMDEGLVALTAELRILIPKGGEE